MFLLSLGKERWFQLIKKIKFYDENVKIHPFTDLFHKCRTVFWGFYLNQAEGCYICKNCGCRMSDIYANSGYVQKRLEAHEC